jgi:hypothetical protein
MTYGRTMHLPVGEGGPALPLEKREHSRKPPLQVRAPVCRTGREQGSATTHHKHRAVPGLFPSPALSALPLSQSGGVGR